MKAYLAQIVMNLKLTMRDRMVLFFNYAFPLIFFFIFASLFRAEQASGLSVEVVTMVLVIGVLGNGFFGAGIRATVDREMNILRRFKVAPISAGPILVSSLVTGWLNYLPSAILIVSLAHFVYRMPWPLRPMSLFVYLSLGVLAFRALGLMIASVVNSMQESQIVTQLLYFPMLFLSGATIPITALPTWLQVVTQFIPATYLFTGMQAIMGANETIAQNASGAAALVMATLVATFLGVKLFRWEKDEKIRPAAKLWLAAVLFPFLVLGAYQVHSRQNLAKSKMLLRHLQRSRTLLIRNARIFVGDGNVIENGSILVRDGRIAELYGSPAPDAKALKAEVIEAAGKTVLPGLIDVHVHLAMPGGAFPSASDYNLPRNMPRELAAYLYSGVTAVKSEGSPLNDVLNTRRMVGSGERLGAEVLVSGPMFTTAGGHGTEFTQAIPKAVREAVGKQMVRTPATEAEARAQVDEFKHAGVDAIKATLETRTAGHVFPRMSVAVLRAIVSQAHADGLTVAVRTGDASSVADAIGAAADSIEHGSFRERLPDDLLARMKAQGMRYEPTLVAAESGIDAAAGNVEPLERPLVMQVGPANLIEATRALVLGAPARHEPAPPIDLAIARDNLLRAARAGVDLVTGSGSGRLLIVHGPALHRELQLWVAAGISPAAALQAATYGAARLLRADQRIGIVALGHEANLLIVNGNPLQDIRQTESIQQVIFKGEQIDRSALFDQE